MSLLRRVIGAVLRRERQRQGLTLRELAEAAGVSVPYLSEVERGRKEASSEVLAAICRALGLYLSDLLEAVRDELRRVERRVPSARLGTEFGDRPDRLVAVCGAGHLVTCGSLRQSTSVGRPAGSAPGRARRMRSPLLVARSVRVARPQRAARHGRQSVTRSVFARQSGRAHNLVRH